MNTLNGLPLHVLLVHAVVVLMPLSALLLLLTTFSASARRRFAGANVLLALSTVVLVPVTTSAGEWLEGHLARTDLIRRHADVGGTAIYLAIALAVLATIVWWRERETVATSVPAAVRESRETPVGTTLTKHAAVRRTWLAPASKAITRAIAVAAVLVAIATLYDVYKIGDSGAKASWDGKVTSAPYIRG